MMELYKGKRPLFQTLSETQRQVMILRNVEGMDSEDI